MHLIFLLLAIGHGLVSVPVARAAEARNCTDPGIRREIKAAVQERLGSLGLPRDLEVLALLSRLGDARSDQSRAVAALIQQQSGLPPSALKLVRGRGPELRRPDVPDGAVRRSSERRNRRPRPQLRHPGRNGSLRRRFAVQATVLNEGHQGSMVANRDVMANGGGLTGESELTQLGAFLRGRTFGLLALDGLPGLDLLLQAHVFASACIRQAGLGLITLAAGRRTNADIDGAEDGAELEVTLLLIGPMGDDHGRVLGALRTLGEQCAQARAMIKRHDLGSMTRFWVGGRAASDSAAVQADGFDATKLGTYCASLRSKPLDRALAIEVEYGASFFRRRPTAWRVAGCGLLGPAPVSV